MSNLCVLLAERYRKRDGLLLCALRYFSILHTHIFPSNERQTLIPSYSELLYTVEQLYLFCPSSIHFVGANKAYIPLRHKIPLPNAIPRRQNFALGIPTGWYLKTRKFASPPTPNLKFAFPPTQNPNASQWNIGCLGYQTQISGVRHVHFIFFVSISFALGSQFPVEYGLKSNNEVMHIHTSLYD